MSEISKYDVPEDNLLPEVYDIDLLGNDTFGFTSQIIARDKSTGKSAVLVDLKATFNNTGNYSVNFSINILNKEMVENNKEAVQNKINIFLASINKHLEESGGFHL